MVLWWLHPNVPTGQELSLKHSSIGSDLLSVGNGRWFWSHICTEWSGMHRNSVRLKLKHCSAFLNCYLCSFRKKENNWIWTTWAFNWEYSTPVLQTHQRLLSRWNPGLLPGRLLFECFVCPSFLSARSAQVTDCQAHSLPFTCFKKILESTMFSPQSDLLHSWPALIFMNSENLW